jgi:peptidoglycan hydrolase-like protein with peptidoglycan-binding domain
MIPSLLVLGALLGVTIVGVAQTEAAPPAIGGAVPVGEVPVTSTKYLDVRSVTLAFETQLQGEIVTPVGGFITRTSCAVGGEAQSGESGIAINGRSLVYLASGAPLWRDLGPDSVGSDVRGLQTELNRLGYSLDADGEFGPLTLRAARDLAERNGVDSSDWSVIPREAFVWIPAPATGITSCPTVLGASVAPDDALFVAPPVIASARVAALPDTLAPGPRVIVAGEVRVAVDDQGAIADPAALHELGRSSEFAAWVAADDGTDFIVDLELASPVTVTTVPPAAVFGLDGSTGCISSAGHTVVVEVVGSGLGQSYVVVPADAEVVVVDVRLPPGRPCG